MVRNASKKVQDALVCIVAQEIDHALRKISVRNCNDMEMIGLTSGIIALPSLPLTYLNGISTLSAAETWILGRST